MRQRLGHVAIPAVAAVAMVVVVAAAATRAAAVVVVAGAIDVRREPRLQACERTGARATDSVSGFPEHVPDFPFNDQACGYHTKLSRLHFIPISAIHRSIEIRHGST